MIGDEWLEKLKVGDTVIASSLSSLGGRDRLGTVLRFTKTQIIVNVEGYETRFRRIGGHEAGDHGYHGSWLIEATPERVAAYQERRYRSVFQNKLHNLSWNDVPLDVLKQVRELIEPYVKRQEKE